MTAGEVRRAVLDTSVLIEFPAAQVAEVVDEVAVSAVTIGELHYGVTAAADPLTQLHRRRRVLTRNGDDFSGLGSALTVIDLRDQP